MDRTGCAGKSEGFTLIEVLVTIAVLVILASLAVPSFSSVFRSNRAASEANQVLSLVMLARSEAIRRNRSVSICGSTDGATCSGEQAWDDGVIVFVDPTGVQDRDPNDPEQTLVQSVVPLSRVSTISINRDTGTLSYTPLGRTAGNALGTITIQPTTGSETFNKKVLIARNGRPRVQ